MKKQLLKKFYAFIVTAMLFSLSANAQWTTANLSQARSNLSATAVGTKVFFAGGSTGAASSVVDIYDNSTGLWTTANLSVARYDLSATVVGTKVFFAGGDDGIIGASSVVDIYDNSTGLWTTANLSVARSDFSATAVGTKAFFAGGSGNGWSTVVDIYVMRNPWTTSSELQKVYH